MRSRRAVLLVALAVVVLGVVVWLGWKPVKALRDRVSPPAATR